MSKTRRLIHIAAMPVVAGAIYAWLIRQACKDAVHMIQLRRKPR
jgi:hypothetical protein